MKKGFTLVELLITIIIIAILATVVLVVLDPVELGRQSNDAKRLADMNTLNKAVALYYSDAIDNPSALSMGSSSVVYVSVPDTSSVCANLGLPALPAGWSYHCASPLTYVKTDGTGWVPINFDSYSSGSIISSLPIDPTNTVAKNLYYTYESDGVGGYKLSAFFESKKDGPLMKNDEGIDPELYEKGSNLALIPARGLVGYWPLSEGTGSSTIDYSGSNATGTWNGTPAGTNGYYSPGSVNTWAGAFNGTSTNTYVNAGTSAALNLTGPFTLSAWINLSATNQTNVGIIGNSNSMLSGYSLGLRNGKFNCFTNQSGAVTQITTTNFAPVSQWANVVCTFDGSTATIYVNGISQVSGSVTAPTSATLPLELGSTAQGGWSPMTGLLDDVRVYNRALSATEIKEMYNAEQ